MKRKIRTAAAALLAAALFQGGAQADPDRLLVNATRYDQEYPVIDYSGPAHDNPVWHLQQKINSGEAKLNWEPKWGYLRSVMQGLGIAADSQVLVYSKTSLQTEFISASTPRAIYFGDDAYVAWIPGAPLLELVAVDAKLGTVFFALDNRAPGARAFERDGGRCLTCHDTYSMMGGGVPRVLAMSAPVDSPMDPRTYDSATEVNDRTPIAERWGGWYVTGHQGKQTHLGNLPLREEKGTEHLRSLAHDNLRTLAGYFNTDAYLLEQSDIAALMVFEHQTTIQNLLIRVNYKVRTVMSREGSSNVAAPRSWADVNPNDQAAVKLMIEPLVRGLFFVDAAKFDDRIESGSGFAARFSALGPRDPKGRSLRELDLNTRLFKYPLSFMVYADAFESLPPYARDYVDGRIAEILQGRDKSGIGARIPQADREAVVQILSATKPRYTQLLAAAH
ncbi:MAG: hypothetical protein ABI616_04400 [Pseudomonadota bacterium]